MWWVTLILFLTYCALNVHGQELKCNKAPTNQTRRWARIRTIVWAGVTASVMVNLFIFLAQHSGRVP